MEEIDTLWKVFKKGALQVQHRVNNMFVQSYNQAVNQRRDQVGEMGNFEEQQLQQAVALSLGESPSGNPNLFPQPLPDRPPADLSPSTPPPSGSEDSDDEAALKKALQESLKEAKERGILPKEEEEEPVRASPPSPLVQQTAFANFDFDNVDEAILEIRQQRQEERKRKQLLSEQDKSYEESLFFDRQRREEEERKRREEERRVEEEWREEREEREREEMEEAISLSKQISSANSVEKLRERLPEEPEKGDRECSEIVVRLTNGEKISRRFRASNTLSQLRDWVAVCSAERDRLPSHFSLSTPFPRRKFEEMDKTLKDLALFPSALLIVEEEEEEDLYDN